MQRLNSKRTYSEIYEILNILGKDAIDKLPNKLYALIENEMDEDYKPNLLGEDGLLDKAKISQETIALFALLNIKYFMQDSEEKDKLLKIYKKNEEEYQKKLQEKYNPDDIFKNKNTVDSQPKQESINTENNKNLPVKVEKTSIFKRIRSFIKKIFHTKH